MDIIFEPSHLTITFDRNETKGISKLMFNGEGICQVFSLENKLISEFKTVCSPVFNMQYGTPISPDDRFLFVGSWEKGLFCYDIQSGKLLWKKTPGKVGTIIVHSDSLIIEMVDRGIYKREINTGDLITQIKMSSMGFLFKISENQIFTGPHRGKYYIFEIPSLSVLKEIPWSALNINNCLSFIVLECKKHNDNLIFSGWEEYSDRNPENKGSKRFTREITIEI